MLSRPRLTVLWTFTLAILCRAGPINRQASGHNTLRLDGRNQSNTELNVCVSDDVLYQPGDLMPAPNPCQRCVCSPPGSQCVPVTCEKKPGCKALLRPNQCCPEYQCECERNGRRYQNGERLDNAENPCEACYCQGGEVVCTTVECYRRDDCEPQFVPGRCCPKYDHCPPLVMDDARFAEPAAVDSARPQHTRATFQPNLSASDADDQDLGASNVQERVHLPAVATATTTPAPATDAADATTAQPQSASADAAIKIDVPAVPWTDTTDADAATPAPSDAPVEGSGAADADAAAEKSSDGALVGVIEHIADPARRDGDGDGEGDAGSATAPTEESPTTAKARDEAVESQTQQEVGVTRLFMISKEAELDPTTVSSEYTDVPAEMSTTPEAILYSKEATVPQGVDMSTEALIEVTSAVNDTTPSLESSTDSSPEFKDFDEWTGVKSSEFMRDGASTGLSSDHVDSSSSSDSHFKQSSSSDESTSHFLATNINPETVKLPSDSNLNSALDSDSSHSDPASTDSTESSESTEESATTEISTERENIAIGNSDTDALSLTKDAEAGSKEENRVEQRIDLNQSNEKTKEEESVTAQKNDKEKGQLDIILDTVATDENGPPILLIGDDLANHQMDIVVATAPTEAPETGTNIPESEVESRIGAKDSSTEQSETATGETPSSEDASTDAPSEETGTEVSEGTTAATVNGDDDAKTEGDETATETKDATASTEKANAPDTQQEMMLSDDPLPGQAISSETAVNEENLDETLGKTENKNAAEGDPQKEDETQSATLLTTLAVEETTVNSVELRSGDLRTESPEKESTTNTAQNEEVTTQEPEVTTVVDVKRESKPDEPIDAEVKVAERRGDVIDETADDTTTDGPTAKDANENPTTTEFITTQRSDAENTVAANEDNILGEQTTELPKEHADLRSQPLEEKNSEPELKDDQASEQPPKEATTTLIPEATDIPATQVPAVSEISSNKYSTGEELMFGDEPQSDDPASINQPSDTTEQKQEEQKEEKTEVTQKENTEEKSESEDRTELIQKTGSDEATEVAQRIDLEIPSEPAQSSESAPATESDLKGDLQQSTESAQKTESGVEAPQNDESEKTSEQKVETATEVEQQGQKEEEPSQILVDNSKISEKEDVLRVGNLQQASSDELSTPPPDTTSADANVEEETTTSPSAKGVEPETEASTEETTDKAEEKPSTDVKINPEVLELKPIPTAVPTPPPAAANATEPDSTTLSPQWLKTENDTKAQVSQEPQEQSTDDSAVREEQEAQSDTNTTADATEQHAPATPGDAAPEQLRLERRVDEEDKKDLFLLEDFFTKLYRHQIATDATKH